MSKGRFQMQRRNLPATELQTVSYTHAEVDQIIHKRDLMSQNWFKWFADYAQHSYALQHCIDNVITSALQWRGDLLRVALGFQPLKPIHNPDVQVLTAQDKLPNAIEALNGLYANMLSAVEILDKEQHAAHLAYYQPLVDSLNEGLHTLRKGDDDGATLCAIAKQHATIRDQITALYRSASEPGRPGKPGSKVIREMKARYTIQFGHNWAAMGKRMVLDLADLPNRTAEQDNALHTLKQMDTRQWSDYLRDL